MSTSIRAFNPDQIPAPPFSILWPSRDEFPKRAFEIGGGTGEFAKKFAAQNPDCFLVSVERTKNKSNQILKRPEDLYKLSNLFFVRADAVNVMVHCVPNESLDQVFLLYPNPYPKKKHANQRWHNMPFMYEILKKLKSAGTLELRTNIQSYFDEAKESLTNNFGLYLKEETALTEACSAVTAFERKYLLRKELCWRAIFQKV